MSDEIEKLKTDFEGNEIKIILMMTLVAIYPLLAKLGFSLAGPIAIVVNSERQLSKLLDLLDAFRVHVTISIAEQPKKVEKHLMSAKYGCVFFRFAEGRYALSNLKEIVATGQRIERIIHNINLSIVLAVKEMPKSYAENFAGIVYIKESPRTGKFTELSGEGFFRKIIPYALNHIPEIKNAGEWKRTEEDDPLFAILAAAEALKLFIRTEKLGLEEVKELDQKIEDVLTEIRDEWWEADDPQAYAAAFRKSLFRNEDILPPIFDREHFTGMDLKNERNLMYFDGDFYYMPEPVFRKICEKIRRADVNYVKSQLVAAGLLISEGKERSYYTKQTEIITVYGYIMKIRLVKLVREKIDLPGELSLQERIEMRKGSGDVGGSEIGESSEFPELCEDR